MTKINKENRGHWTKVSKVKSVISYPWGGGEHVLGYTTCLLKPLTLLLLVLCCQWAVAQEKTISITIDDIPNTAMYQKNGFRSDLLLMLDALEVPFTIFINEDKIYRTRFRAKNKKLLEAWIANERSLVGNHSFSHPRYSEVEYEAFAANVIKGEELSKVLAGQYGKEIQYFRFPFNDLGKDSLQHHRMRDFMASRNRAIAPFTVESSDWMFDVVYRHYLDQGDLVGAKAVGEAYVEKTMAMLAHFETVAQTVHGRPMSHIYLCHDNRLNTDYLETIILRLKAEGYSIVGLDQSLEDPLFQLPDRYYKKWGISWLYRWMDSQKIRVSWMRQEPSLKDIENTYQEIIRKQ